MINDPCNIIILEKVTLKYDIRMVYGFLRMVYVWFMDGVRMVYGFFFQRLRVVYVWFTDFQEKKKYLCFILYNHIFQRCMSKIHI